MNPNSMYYDFLPDLDVIRLGSVDSTNNYIKNNYAQLQDRLPVLVTSREQTGGRGRSRRVWVSPPGKGLYSSFGFYLGTDKPLQLLPLIAGISVIQTLNEISGVRLGLKWPNDVIYHTENNIGYKKIAGILIENIIHENHIFCVVGMGLNLNHECGDFPVELNNKAVSLRMLTGESFDPEHINRKLASTFFHWLEILTAERVETIVNKAETYTEQFRDKEIRFHRGETVITGVFKGINRDGGLVLETKDGNGEMEIFYSGEIV